MTATDVGWLVLLLVVSVAAHLRTAYRLWRCQHHLIWRILKQDGDHSGLALVERGLATRGSVYVILENLQEAGLVEQWEAGGQRFFRATGDRWLV